MSYELVVRGYKGGFLVSVDRKPDRQCDNLEDVLHCVDTLERKNLLERLRLEVADEDRAIINGYCRMLLAPKKDSNEPVHHVNS